jgi:hypothetical protein
VRQCPHACSAWTVHVSSWWWDWAELSWRGGAQSRGIAGRMWHASFLRRPPRSLARSRRPPLPRAHGHPCFSSGALQPWLWLVACTRMDPRVWARGPQRAPRRWRCAAASTRGAAAPFAAALSSRSAACTCAGPHWSGAGACPGAVAVRCRAAAGTAMPHLRGALRPVSQPPCPHGLLLALAPGLAGLVLAPVQARWQSAAAPPRALRRRGRCAAASTHGAAASSQPPCPHGLLLALAPGLTGLVLAPVQTRWLSSAALPLALRCRIYAGRCGLLRNRLVLTGCCLRSRRASLVWCWRLSRRGGCPLPRRRGRCAAASTHGDAASSQPPCPHGLLLALAPGLTGLVRVPVQARWLSAAAPPRALRRRIYAWRCGLFAAALSSRAAACTCAGPHLSVWRWSLFMLVCFLGPGGAPLAPGGKRPAPSMGPFRPLAQGGEEAGTEPVFVPPTGTGGDEAGTEPVSVPPAGTGGEEAGTELVSVPPAGTGGEEAGTEPVSILPAVTGGHEACTLP